MTTIKSTCSYCASGCGIAVTLAPDGTRTLAGDATDATTQGALCVKGQTLLEANGGPRLTRPLLRVGPDGQPRKASQGGKLEPCSWERALEFIVERIQAATAAHGRDSVAMYESGLLTTEEHYLIVKLFKGCIGTPHVDANSRLCVSSAARAYWMAFGADAPPTCYDDFAVMDAYFLFGCNLLETFPVPYLTLRRRKKAETPIIVIDVRRTPTARAADLFVAPRPGSDIALLHGMAFTAIDEGLDDRPFLLRYATGLEEYRRGVARYTPDVAERLTGIPAGMIRLLGLVFATGGVGKEFEERVERLSRLGRIPELPACFAKRLGASAAPRGTTLSTWARGFDQSTLGVQKNLSLLSLHLVTGQIGRPGAGPLSMTGQCNAMGERETGATADGLPGYRKVADEQHRRDMADLWGVQLSKMADRPGLTALDLPRAILGEDWFKANGRPGNPHDPRLTRPANADRWADVPEPLPEKERKPYRAGEVRFLWCMGSNPAVSWPDTGSLVPALDAVETLVVSDYYEDVETLVRFADLALPSATSLEREGTFTSAERRIRHVAPVMAPPGEARPDWQVLRDVGRRLGFEKQFPYESPEEVFREWKVATLDTPVDIMGVKGYAQLKAKGGIYWPAPNPGLAAAGGARRRYLAQEPRHKGFAFPDGKARLLFYPHNLYPLEELRFSEEPCDLEYPFTLNTGRIYALWQTNTRTGRVPQLAARYQDNWIELNAADAERLGIQEGQPLRIETRRGSAELKARVGEALPEGMLHTLIHFPREPINALTTAAYCAISKQPELKACAARIVLDPKAGRRRTRSRSRDGSAAAPAPPSILARLKARLRRAIIDYYKSRADLPGPEDLPRVYRLASGVPEGPYSPNEVRRRVAAGTIGPDDILFSEGERRLFPAREIAGALPVAATSTSTSTSTTAPAAAWADAPGTLDALVELLSRDPRDAFVAVDGRVHGPVTRKEMLAVLRGAKSPDTALVWKGAGWAKVKGK